MKAAGKMISFDNNLKWYGRGGLSLRLRTGETIQDKFKALIAETREAGKIYQQLKNNDNRLIGQERHDLSEELEDILGGFFYIYGYILNAGEDSFFSCYSSRHELFKVKFTGFLWEGSGELKSTPVTGLFSDWFNNILLMKIGGFISDYGKAFSDGFLDGREKELLLSGLNDVIIQLLLAEKGLKLGVLV